MSLGKANELLAKRAKLFTQARQLYDDATAEGRDLTSEEQSEFDRKMDECDRLDARARKIEEDLARLEAQAEERELTKETLERAGRRGDDPEEYAEEYRKAFWAGMQGGNEALSREQRQMLHETRALAKQVVGTPAAGGYLVPEDFRAELITALKAYGGIREACRVFETATGRDLPWPRSDDTGNGAKLVGEAVKSTNSTAVPFGSVTLGAHMYRSGPIKISFELEQDDAIGIESIVRDAMRIRFGRKMNTDMTVGSTGPAGIIAATSGSATISGIPSSFDFLHDLEASVDPAYRSLPGAGWMFNDDTRKILRKIRESTAATDRGMYLWEPRITAGSPDMLLGYPVYINQDLGSFATAGSTTQPVLFGAFNYYMVRDVRNMFMLRLTERYADEGVFALQGYLRADGRAVQPSTTPAQKAFRCIRATT